METTLFRAATREELNIAFQWASEAGWNPGLGDADIFWETDPDGYVVVEREGEVVGTGSIVSYSDFGFMGFFIIKKGLRGRGIGRDFWNWRKRRLHERLEPGAVIGMDGVFEMQTFYAKGGFRFTYRNLRMEGLGETSVIDDRLVDLSRVPFAQVLELDTRCFGYNREAFLRRWIESAHATAIGHFEDERLKGYGVIRQCITGYKIGPLFAETSEVAEVLFRGLSNYAPGQPIFLDVPEVNTDALSLAMKYGMAEVFGCARMYAGPIPELPWDTIYGVTTFELG